MANIESKLVERASVLAPTPAQVRAASTSHNHLRGLLSTGQIGGRIQRSFLAGSYARDTAIRPLDDVDIVFEIDASHWNVSFWRDHPTPKKVLDTFARALRRRYPDTSVRTQRRSVGLMMNHLHIDVVPAIPHSRQDWIQVPDTRSDSWVASAPSNHTAFATEVNKACGQKFKPLVRLLKGWNGSLPDSARQKSFAVETLAATVMRAMPQATLTHGLFYVLDFIAWRGGHKHLHPWSDALGIVLVSSVWTPTISDVGGAGSNLLDGAEPDSLSKFCEHGRDMRDLLVAASNAPDAWRVLSPLITGGLAHL